MSLINGEAAGELWEWARENEDRSIFPQISKGEASYYMNRNSEETYIMEYSFKTIAELKALLERHSGLSEEPQMLKKMAVEVCQNRFRGSMDTGADSSHAGTKTEAHKEMKKPEIKKEPDDEKVLPEFIYVF